MSDYGEWLGRMPTDETWIGWRDEGRAKGYSPPANGAALHHPEELTHQPDEPGDDWNDATTLGLARPYGKTVRLAEVTPERVEWLWPARIPLGKITILDGDPGLGKSTLSIDLAARVSTGRPMPGEVQGREPAGVILMSAEHGLADTIRPRLDAAGADASRVVALVGIVAVDGTERLPSLPGDLVRLEAAIVAEGADLVVVDVLMAYLGGDVNGHRDQDVRGALAPLAAMAERTGAAILVLRHLNKSSGGPAVYRGGGSIGIVGAARSALVVGRDPQDETRCVLAVTKANLSPIAPSLAYRIVDRDGTGAIEWIGVTRHTAEQLLAAPASEEDRSAEGDAKAFLGELLASGPVKATDVQREARDAGIAPRTLDRAKASLGIRSIRVDGFTGPWSWELPDVHRQGSTYIASQIDGDVRGDVAMYASESSRPALALDDEMAEPEEVDSAIAATFPWSAGPLLQ